MIKILRKTRCTCSNYMNVNTLFQKNFQKCAMWQGFNRQFHVGFCVVAVELPLFKRGHDNCLRNKHGQSDRYALPGPNRATWAHLSSKANGNFWYRRTAATQHHSEGFTLPMYYFIHTLIRLKSWCWRLVRDNGSSRASQYVPCSSMKSYLSKDTHIAR